MKTKETVLYQTSHRRFFIRIFAAVGILILSGFIAQAGQGPQPSICTRSCWSARAAACSFGTLTSLSRAIIHHTANSSDYTTDYEVAKARVRGTQNYHMDNNGWCDIGYHFLVSAGGHIFEGLNGSMSGLPRGAHDGCNANSFGFSNLGYYHPPYNHAFTTATRNSLEAVIAWRMPSTWSSLGSGTYCGYTAGTLDGHFIVSTSVCPGDIIVAQIPNLRDGVNARKNPAPSSGGASLRLKMDVSGDGKTDIILLWNNGGETTARVRLSNGSTFTGGSDNVIVSTFGTLGVDRQWIPMDVNGDGKTDLTMIWNSDGEARARTFISNGSSFGGGADVSIAGSFGTLNVTRQYLKGDVNGDGKEDLIMIWKDAGTSEGKVRFLASNGTGFSLLSDTVVTSTWGTLNVDRLWIPVDVSGDGKTDIAVIWNNGGAASARTRISNGTSLIGGGDGTVAGSFGTIGVDREWLKGNVNGDSREDLILIWNNGGAGTVRTCLSDGTRFGITADTAVTTTWGTLNVDRLWVPMDVNADGKTDISLIYKNGTATTARVRISNGSTFSGGSDNQIASAWDTLNVNRLWLTGDVNGDLKQDFILAYNNGGAGTARTLLSNGSAFSLSGDTSISGTWGTVGLNRLWFPLPK